MPFKRLATAANDPFAQSLAGLEIRDAAGTVTYEKRFPFAVAASRFELPVAVSVERLSGSTGAGLIIHYTELAGASEGTHPQANESWQLFGIVNGKLAPLPQPAVIGEPNLGGPYMGAIMRAANGSVSVVSQPDTIELRAWTGNFYVFIPLRVDWNHG